MLVNQKVMNSGTYTHAEGTPEVGQRYPRTRISRVIHGAPVRRLMDSVSRDAVPPLNIFEMPRVIFGFLAHLKEPLCIFCLRYHEAKSSHLHF